VNDTRRRRKRLAAGGAAVAAVALGIILLTDGSDDKEPSGRSSGVEVTSGVSPNPMRYPRTVEGRVGRDTTFVNDDSRPHTFTSDTGLFDSGTLEPEAEFVVSTLPAGTYPYHCSIHPDLTGTLTITE